MSPRKYSFSDWATRPTVVSKPNAIFGYPKGRQTAVIFKNGAFVTDDACHTEIQYCLKVDPPYEVIGNIYENPELLEK